MQEVGTKALLLYILDSLYVNVYYPIALITKGNGKAVFSLGCENSKTRCSTKYSNTRAIFSMFIFKFTKILTIMRNIIVERRYTQSALSRVQCKISLNVHEERVQREYCYLQQGLKNILKKYFATIRMYKVELFKSPFRAELR